jgi:FMN phosphatase YigB (HAD superfamily)
MIGDSLTSDFKGALNMGLDFCWINPENNKVPQNLPTPRYTIKSVKELASILC